MPSHSFSMRYGPLTVRHDNDNAERFEMDQSPLPLLSSLLIFVLPDGLGPFTLERTFILLRFLSCCKTRLIRFSTTFGEVADFGWKSGLEV